MGKYKEKLGGKILAPFKKGRLLQTRKEPDEYFSAKTRLTFNIQLTKITNGKGQGFAEPKIMAQSSQREFLSHHKPSSVVTGKNNNIPISTLSEHNEQTTLLDMLKPSCCLARAMRRE